MFSQRAHFLKHCRGHSVGNRSSHKEFRAHTSEHLHIRHFIGAKHPLKISESSTLNSCQNIHLGPEHLTAPIDHPCRQRAGRRKQGGAVLPGDVFTVCPGTQKQPASKPGHILPFGTRSCHTSVLAVPVLAAFAVQQAPKTGRRQGWWHNSSK